jgi:hypothetical protein
MKPLTLLSVVAVLATLVTGNANAQASGLDGRDIDGAWIATWTFTKSSVPFVPVGFSFSALHAFHAGGTLTSVDDDLFDSSGIGVWERTDERKYKFAFTFFVADDQSPGHAAALVGFVTARITYDPRQSGWVGTFRSTLKDRNGNVIGEFGGDVVANRMGL